MLLARNPQARAYVSAGMYTRPEVCRNFLRQAEDAGLQWIDRGGGSGEEDGRETDAVWRGSLLVRGLDVEQLGVRKGMCRWWVAKWSSAIGNE